MLIFVQSLICRIGWWAYHTENLFDKRNIGKTDSSVTMERSVPLNLDLTCMKVGTKLEDADDNGDDVDVDIDGADDADDLTCMKVETKLEDSLAIASTALNLVKNVEPSIITIQCLIAEESLDYLLFKKLPGNNFCKKFTKSTDINRQPNSCVAWKVGNQSKNS